MKNFVFAIMVIFSVNCQTSSTSAQEQEIQVQKDPIGSAQDTPPPAQSSNPDEVVFQVDVLENFSSGKEICGISKKNVFKINVVEIMEKGLGISHMPLVNDDILVHFLFPNEDIEVGIKLEVKAKESLCSDTSKSYFTVISHKILE